MPQDNNFSDRTRLLHPRLYYKSTRISALCTKNSNDFRERILPSQQHFDSLHWFRTNLPVFPSACISRISVSRVSSLFLFFCTIIKEKIAGWEKNRVPLPCYSLALLSKLQDAHVDQRWWFSGEGEAKMGMENVLQTCLAIPKKKKERERKRYKLDSMTAIKERQDLAYKDDIDVHYSRFSDIVFSFLMTAITNDACSYRAVLKLCNVRSPWTLEFKRQWSLTLEIYGWLVGEFNISRAIILYMAELVQWRSTAMEIGIHTH